ncbi:hypothetical protein ACFPIJ_03180 [Dactylosporangium cerinum]|uniref:Uncharacterized protein n=1 Tax=Dactylosporangium cerinum TaxID=1434730 RepID=A0ABV9VLG6_9ACTN
MSEYYDGGADHATYEGHDAYQGEEHGDQYADVQAQVHHVIELIGEKIDGIEHNIDEAYDQPAQHDAYASDEYKADSYQADDHKADEYKGYSPYARS